MDKKIDLIVSKINPALSGEARMEATRDILDLIFALKVTIKEEILLETLMHEDKEEKLEKIESFELGNILG